MPIQDDPRDSEGLDPGVLYIVQALRSWKCEKIPEQTCFLRAKFQSIEPRREHGNNGETGIQSEYKTLSLVSGNCGCLLPKVTPLTAKTIANSFHGHPNEFNSGQPS